MIPSKIRLPAMARWISRRIYLLIILVICATACIAFLRPARHVSGGPSVVITIKSPDYAAREVQLKAGAHTLGSLLNDVASQAQVRMEGLWLPGNADRPVTIDQDQKLPLADALTLIRARVPAGMSYEMRQDRLVVGDDQVLYAPSRLETRVYPVAYFLEDDNRWISTTTSRGRLAQLVSLIQGTIEPDRWRDNGGTDGTITAIGDKIVIQATPEMHEKIGELLAALRSK